MQNRMGLLFFLVALLVACSGKGPAPAQELHVYNWSAYIDPQIYRDFEAEFGIRVVEDTFASNEELLAKLQAGATGYDIIVPSDYMVSIMLQQGLLAELDRSKIPNLVNIDPQFSSPPYDPGMRYCVPYQWGTTGIGYNSATLPTAPDSWAYLFDPDLASRYAGKFTMLNDAREVIGAALKYLGYSMNTTNEAELLAARDLLIRQKPWVYAYDSEQYRALLPAGEIVMAQGYSGDVFMVAEEDERIRYVIPREGTSIWMDNLCIPARAPNKEAAHLFINYLLRPDIGARISNYTRYASPNAAARAHIEPELLSDPAVYPPPEVMARLEWIRDVGEATLLYERIWTEVKAATP
ncbi:MAG: spermidine/putrescine ABC transporter substrate-binding protein [Anaerolineae bacterium]|nr:spermidine/putrescine ABC transporter substrate-binding protein [Anaerolineae bacterium]MDW7991907.1 spermidine/putrescine ABC transporter substrate-binding protein [Anaerolineae bacterium]